MKTKMLLASHVVRRWTILLFACFVSLLVSQQEWDCGRPWPDLELFLPVAIREGNRKNEWREIFLRTFLLFWPIEDAKTKLLVLVDEEHRGSEGVKAITNELTTINRMKDLWRIGYNNPNSTYFLGDGSIRQQYLMFYADNFTTSEFVGFVDTDAFFLTYVDREDLFENGKPVINGKIGNPHKRFNKDPLWHMMTNTTYDVLGLEEPMKCMAYFPVIIKTKHLRLLREYLEKKYGKPFYDVFRLKIADRMFSQFNFFCTYLFYFHQDEYRWYAHDHSPEWDYKNGVRGQLTNRSAYSAEMQIPKPRIAVHARYRVPENLDGSYGVNTCDVLQTGICFSPPFPKVEDWAPCRFYKDERDFENEIFHEMHKFEYSDFTTVYPLDTLRHEAYSRFQRIRHCNHSWSRDSVFEDVEKIMSVGLKLEEGTLIYSQETGRRVFMLQNNTLRGFPNYDTFVAMGCVGKPSTRLTYRQMRMIAKGPDLPPLNA